MWVWEGGSIVTKNYSEILPLLEARYEEIYGFDFYREIFPDNEDEGELHTDYSRPNAIYLYRDPADTGSKRTLRRRIMLNDTWEEDYMEFVERNPLTLCNGLAYRGRANRLEKAQRMYALAFDLDGVGDKELRTLFLRFEHGPEIIRTVPVPTFLVASGNGLHLYYVFQEPIDLYPNIKVQLKALKYALTFRMWDYKSTSQKKTVQYQSINQGFRMVGSVNEKYDTVIRAFRVGGRVTLDYLNQYVKEKDRVDINRPFRPSKMTRDQAKEAYPEWYERVIVRKEKNLKKWDIAGKVHGDNPYALYDWWRGHAGQIRGGHRYYFLMCMAIYASKCDVPRAKLRADLREVYEDLKQVEHDNPLKLTDIESALEAYSKEYYNFKIEDIEKLTDLRIERNKRNGQSQKDHLEEARAIRDIRMKRQGKRWDEDNGRPSKKEEVLAARAAHPEASISELARITGFSRNTIRKYLS